MWATIGLIGLLAVGLLAVVVRSWPTANGLPLVNLIQPQDEALATVRAWLKENSSEGEWEEVRWWPARIVKSKNHGVISVARLKYRMKTPLGKLLIDKVWVFDANGRLDWAHDAHPHWPPLFDQAADWPLVETIREIVALMDAEPAR